MKVIIAGSRDLNDLFHVRKAIYASGFEITEVVSGGARGVDRQGEDWARDHEIPVRLFRADWSKYGKGAGPVRNRLMATYADALIAVWDGQSPGTADMIAQARAHNLPVYVYQTDGRLSALGPDDEQRFLAEPTPGRQDG